MDAWHGQDLQGCVLFNQNACAKSATREWNLQRSIGAPENVYTSLKMGRTHGMDKGMGWISEMMAARSYLFNHNACEFL